VCEFDFSGMEIKWGSRYTVTEHEKAAEWEEEIKLAAASLSRARRRKEPVLLCKGSVASKGRCAQSKRNEMILCKSDFLVGGA
jgi:hypothetical protein